MNVNWCRALVSPAVVGLVFGLAMSNTCLSRAPILQPGAPGEATRELDAKTAIDIADTSYTTADAEFMRGMIIHHYQALMMSRLAVK